MEDDKNNLITSFAIDKEYTNMLIIAIDLARSAISHIIDLNEKEKKKNSFPQIKYKVNDLYIEFTKRETICEKVLENEFEFWFYSDKITANNWMDGKKGINFSIIFDKNNSQGRIQYYRDSITLNV
ncbi:hypothetical protein GJU43_11935 [Flavobacterium sp. LC2016-23]|uniref:hypothetical protein n=1 Tax=Flavobacterium sp. LC2016-23 TaxID=2666330 RepID=UPI0012AF12A3|nr:hypothetical protein [Flavobacterium sp. LC2016-23]MRX39987.1 hypothetical protein [Flavobacterium sp. LC2016-23]